MPEQTTHEEARRILLALSADGIRARLHELDSEADALRVLLRAARARERNTHEKGAQASNK
jgi:hypothetical protein